MHSTIQDLLKGCVAFLPKLFLIIRRQVIVEINVIFLVKMMLLLLDNNSKRALPNTVLGFDVDILLALVLDPEM